MPEFEFGDVEQLQRRLRLDVMTVLQGAEQFLRVVEFGTVSPRVTSSTERRKCTVIRHRWWGRAQGGEEPGEDSSARAPVNDRRTNPCVNLVSLIAEERAHGRVRQIVKRSHIVLDHDEFRAVTVPVIRSQYI